jgi:alanine racemase
MKTWIEISKSNLLSNLEQFQRILKPKTRLMAVVKSNAYGHGLVEVSKLINDYKPIRNKLWFGVDSIDEALRLKKAGIKFPILILGYVPLSRLSEAARNGFRLTVYNNETIKALGEFSISNFQFSIKSQIPNSKKLNYTSREVERYKINIHIKVETGTSRQGVLEKDILDFVRLIKKYPYINIEGISTHFANIEDTTDHSYAKLQLERFNKIINLLKQHKIEIPIKHTACSAATILFPETHFDMVRVGISLYGHWPSKETFISAREQKKNIKLFPVLTWKTKIAQIKKIKAGTPVSYGLTERVLQDTQIAILPVGYWDGYDRGLSSIGNVLILGRRCKVLGRVCMNMIIVDINHLKNVKVEDEVVLLGRQRKEVITAEEIAQKLGTINYEVLTRINPQIPRIVV